ncbi:hypothetical protein C8K38_11855 [Rhodococcus sp. OK611]|nr:hypothetical protein C8K38_11855 [Rhodococcus sp. OK611]SNX93097.1 hypothetical protein SAMN05447004_11855 [Rhodococcus sp. OK270]
MMAAAVRLTPFVQVGDPGQTDMKGHAVRTSRKSIARAGAVTGLAAIALLANPALGSAAVAGSAAVHTEGQRVIVDVTGVGSPSLLMCLVQVKNPMGDLLEGNPVSLTGTPGAGTYRSQALRDGTYRIEVLCADGDGLTFLTPFGGERVVVGGGSGSSGSSSGSADSPTGS